MVEQVVPKPETEDVVDEAVAPPWMTILHNCDCHTFEQVVKQLQKAIACSESKGWEIAWQVHNTGKAVVKIGPEKECVRVGNILAAIGLAGRRLGSSVLGRTFTPCSRSALASFSASDAPRSPIAFTVSGAASGCA